MNNLSKILLIMISVLSFLIFTDDVTSQSSTCDRLCGEWVTGSCGGGDCSLVQTHENRSCEASASSYGCQISRCVIRTELGCRSCDNLCGDWENETNSCGASPCRDDQRRNNRSCSEQYGRSCPIFRCVDDAVCSGGSGGQPDPVRSQSSTLVACVNRCGGNDELINDADERTCFNDCMNIDPVRSQSSTRVACVNRCGGNDELINDADERTCFNDCMNISGGSGGQPDPVRSQSSTRVACVNRCGGNDELINDADERTCFNDCMNISGGSGGQPDPVRSQSSTRVACVNRCGGNDELINDADERTCFNDCMNISGGSGGQPDPVRSQSSTRVACVNRCGGNDELINDADERTCFNDCMNISGGSGGQPDPVRSQSSTRVACVNRCGGNDELINDADERTCFNDCMNISGGSGGQPDPVRSQSSTRVACVNRCGGNDELINDADERTCFNDCMNISGGSGGQPDPVTNTSGGSDYKRCACGTVGFYEYQVCRRYDDQISYLECSRGCDTTTKRCESVPNADTYNGTLYKRCACGTVGFYEYQVCRRYDDQISYLECSRGCDTTTKRCK